MSRYSRSRFYKRVQVADFEDLDTLSLQWLRFPRLLQGKNVLTHVVKAEEAGRLDLISFRFYGTTDLWWILSLANGYTNVLVEPAAGIVMTIPRQDTVEAFYQTVLSSERGVQVAIPKRTL